MATQFGYFLIADITGYTAYLSESELDHAQKILEALLNLLIKHTRPPLVISRLAGDAVISYGLREGFVTGQTFVEMLEDTYVSFRRQIELMVRNTTCTCNACRNIQSLDLKFFVHYGEFGVQKLDAHDELVGSDVNLIHRLLKNHVVEETGVRAYTLYTDAAIRQLGLGEATDQLIAHAETYEHLGTVKTWVQDMHPVWEAKREAMQVSISADQELYRLEADIAAPPEVIWNHLVRPEHFNVLLGGDKVTLDKRRSGRVAVGSIYQCYHGDHVISNTVVGWHPFERMAVQFLVPVPFDGISSIVELQLIPADYGTHVVEAISKASGSMLGRVAADAGMRMRRQQMQQLLDNFAAHVEAERAAEAQAPAAASINALEIGAAARASLIPG